MTDVFSKQIAVDLPVYHRGHGGRLWAEANEPHGAIFQFTLPAVP